MDNPREVGPDRIVNAVAAFARAGGPCIAVDFGTSTNFDVVSPEGEYVGGVLAPGIEVSMDALFVRAARLLEVDCRTVEHLKLANALCCFVEIADNSGPSAEALASKYAS